MPRARGRRGCRGCPLPSWLQRRRAPARLSRGGARCLAGGPQRASAEEAPRCRVGLLELDAADGADRRDDPLAHHLVVLALHAAEAQREAVAVQPAGPLDVARAVAVRVVLAQPRGVDLLARAETGLVQRVVDELLGAVADARREERLALRVRGVEDDQSAAHAVEQAELHAALEARADHLPGLLADLPGDAGEHGTSRG